MSTSTTASLLALAALASTVAAGKGIVVNNCDFEVNLDNVPASGNGYTSTAKVLSANGGEYSQEWTSLLIGGWSMKLNPSDVTDSVMQFEYTFSDLAPNDLWFDLSYVNGNPFSGNWLIESSDPTSCPVKHSAYLYPTDDANGMQAMCTPDVDITVTLCPSSEQADTSSIISSVESVAPTSTWTSTSTSTSTSTTSTSTTSTTPSTTSTSSSSIEATSTTSVLPKTTTSSSAKVVDQKQVAPPSTISSAAPTTGSTSSPSPTTFSTEASSTTVNEGPIVVTAFDTVIATEVVTVYGHGPHHRRHQHGHRHVHN